MAAGPPEAARIGARIIERGGNAMDAAAAAAMACCMLRPDMTGVGGYVLSAVVLEGKIGRAWCVDANSRAPAAAHERMFHILPAVVAGSGNEGGILAGGYDVNLAEYSCRVKDDANVYGPLSVGPPGMMAGMGVIWERWGQLKWPDIVEPSLGLLRDGFLYDGVAHSIRRHEEVIRRFQPTADQLMPNGELPAEDDTWHRPDMEKTLARVAKAGWRDFYEGELSRKIADYIRSAGGILSRQDMAEYEPRVTEPLTTTYRNATVHGAVLTNGSVTPLQMLNMLECFPPAEQDSIEYWHRLAEVQKLAWRDRIVCLGDPDFRDVPLDRLLSKDYAAERVETMKRFPQRVDTDRPDLAHGSNGCTLHLSTADSEGNVVSATISQGGLFGSCVTVPGTGIILGHGMCRLDPRPGRVNSVASRKRPLNNTCPILTRLPDRDVASGLPGGRQIVGVSAQMVQRIVDYGATGYEAAGTPRLHVEHAEPVKITESAGEEVAEGLRRMGHEVETIGKIAGAAHCAEFLKDARMVRAGGNTWAAGVARKHNSPE